MATGSAVIKELENSPVCSGISTDGEITKGILTCKTTDELVEKYAEAEKLILSSYRFIPLFYKNSYLIAEKENEDIIYDPFTESIDYRIAQNYD